MVLTFFPTCPEDLTLLVFVYLWNIFRALPKIKKKTTKPFQKRREKKVKNHKMWIRKGIFKVSTCSRSYSSVSFCIALNVMFERERNYTSSLYLSLSRITDFYQHQQKAQFIHRTAPYVSTIRATILCTLVDTLKMAVRAHTKLQMLQLQ